MKKAYKNIYWQNVPLRDTPINASNLIAVDDSQSLSVKIKPLNYHDKLVPLICERCGGSINKETYTCEHCGTQYEWR